MYIQLYRYQIGLLQSLNFTECNLFSGVAVSVGTAVWVLAATRKLALGYHNIFYSYICSVAATVSEVGSTYGA